ncbi:MAG TPA: hypothetical protein DCE14_07210 [Kosmotogaceae bacterium]|nr:MAG: Uncharacterized protein XE05_0158 [Thermotogales bacterium 46_20]HAA86114.1 hypothetical protein [Kosmotogaceae bacterium]
MPDSDALPRDEHAVNVGENQVANVFVSKRFSAKMSSRRRALKTKGVKSLIAGIVLVLLIAVGFGGFIGLYVWQSGQSLVEMAEETEKLADVFFETQRLTKVRNDALRDIRDNSRIEEIEEYFGISRAKHEHNNLRVSEPAEEFLRLLNLIISEPAVVIRRLNLNSSLSFPVFPRTAMQPVIRLNATLDISIARVF